MSVGGWGRAGGGCQFAFWGKAGKLVTSKQPKPTPPPLKRYHKPRNSYKSLRSEAGARHSAFSRGSAYLERYCLLIALAGHLEECGLFSATTFRQWLANRPELRLALQSIHTNPAAALAAVPVARPAVVYRAVSPGGVQVTEEEQQVGAPGRAGLMKAPSFERLLT